MLKPTYRRLLIASGLGVLLVLAAVLSWRSLADGSRADRLAADLERRLARVTSVQGRLDITLQGVTLQQELWVMRPLRLRTETVAGPGAFAGTIVVLNEQEGWVYTPALGMASVVDRAGFDVGLAAEAGAGSLLERMPDSVAAALRGGSPYVEGDATQVSGRAVTLLEIMIPPGDASFPPGALQVWLDREFGYPLRWRDATGRELRFTQVSFNQPIDPATFTFIPPPGARVRRVQSGD
jgi:outer membrane lipoprotein-sorting protein